ncbi:MAG: hypothetical protein JW811_01165 [Clostridiales bacterium]|nr:hypothetical protein [Clostridiales bacterium]
MKVYTFFPGFIVALVFAVLVFLAKAFNMNIPLIKDIKQPLIALVIAGFLMCAFSPLANSVSTMFKNPQIDWLVIATALVGILLLVTSLTAIFSSKPLFGLFSKDQSFYVIAGLITVKIALSAIHTIKIS